MPYQSTDRTNIVKHIIEFINQKLNEDRQKSFDDVRDDFDVVVLNKFDALCSQSNLINIEKFLMLLGQKQIISDATLIMTAKYLEAFLEKYKNAFLLEHDNVGLLVLTNFLIAHKINDELNYSNQASADIAGISLKSMNKLEKKFSELMNYDFITIQDNVINKVKSGKDLAPLDQDLFDLFQRQPPGDDALDHISEVSKESESSGKSGEIPEFEEEKYIISPSPSRSRTQKISQPQRTMFSDTQHEADVSSEGSRKASSKKQGTTPSKK